MISDGELASLGDKHGELAHVVYQGKDIVLRKPTGGEYKRFRALSFNEKKRDTALEVLVRDTMVYPAKADIDALFEEFPAVGEVVGPEAIRMAGIVDIEVKK